MGQALDEIIKVIGGDNEESVIKSHYERMPELTTNGKPMSVDYAVSERVKNLLLVVGNYDWTDIGDWKEVWQNLPKDAQNNVIIDGLEPGGEVVNIDLTDSLIHTDGRLIATVGLEGVVIIDTKDALLVCKKDRAQEVKKIVDKFKEDKKDNLL